MAIGPRIDPGAEITASERLPFGCTDDEASRPARSRRQRETYPARQSPPGCPKEAGRLASLAGKPPTSARPFALRSCLVLYRRAIAISTPRPEPVTSVGGGGGCIRLFPPRGG